MKKSKSDKASNKKAAGQDFSDILLSKQPKRKKSQKPMARQSQSKKRQDNLVDDSHHQKEKPSIHKPKKDSRDRMAISDHKGRRPMESRGSQKHQPVSKNDGKANRFSLLNSGNSSLEKSALSSNIVQSSGDQGQDTFSLKALQAQGANNLQSTIQSVSQKNTLGPDLQKVTQSASDSMQAAATEKFAGPNTGKIAIPQQLLAQNGKTLNLNKNQLGAKNLKAGSEASLDEMTQLDSMATTESKGLSKLLSQKQSSGDSTDLKDHTALNFTQDFESFTTDQVDGTESASFAEVMESGQAPKIENMNSIIKQARAVVDDGGGSMEIHLQPEGLGKINLKVAVHEGKVNVEMQSDNPMAKRALEESLADIKTALEGQKLLVETMKVEMSPDYQKDFSDLSNHMQEQANRDFAEQFLGQFRQERDERLGGLFDSFRNFQNGPEEPELQLRSKAMAGQGKGRSLNIVA